MRQPESPSKQREGMAGAELVRGCGKWPVQPHPCQLEPPFDEYDEHTPAPWHCYVNDWECAYAEGMFGRRKSGRRILGQGSNPSVPNAEWADDYQQLQPVVVEQYSEDVSTLEAADQLLRSISYLSRPVSFEILGLGKNDQLNLPDGQITVQFVVHRQDAPLLERQLLSHYPQSAVTLGRQLGNADMYPSRQLHQTGGIACGLCLSHPYILPLNTYRRLDTDPLAVAIAGMEALPDAEWALLQILFTPVTDPLRDNLLTALRDPYQKNQFFFPDVTEGEVDVKFASPLFAVAIRIAGSEQVATQNLAGWPNQFATGQQELIVTDENESTLAHAIGARCVYAPGLILNTEELAGLVHLPGATVASERLRRVKVRTKAAPIHAKEAGAVYLGDNLHRGKEQAVWVPAETRTRHCYIAGASGTGKTTLLKNMILQDIKAGHGVGVIEPHGDLIDDVLNLVPRERVADVVYFNPADDEWPPAFNLLECKDKNEKERVVAETVQTIHKFFADSWGPQLEQYLTYALVTLLKFPGSTLEDLQSILTDDTFRKRHVAKLTDPMLLTFWNKEFAKHGRNAVRPILNKLVPFLLYPTVANVVKQRHSAFDFDQIINERKILLVRLPVGALSEQMISIFGTFIMSKLVSAAFRREKIPEADRVPFHLYIDEFQNFVSLAVSFDRLLSEARKYKLLLHVANQYVDQLPRAIRSAVFGNVKTMVVFRVSPMDSKLLGSEFSGFKPDEITSLDTGQAIARVGGSLDSFNLKCQPPPPPLSPSQRGAIIKRCRHKYARRLKQPVGAALVCEKYVDNVVRFVWGDPDVNEKLMAAVEQELNVPDVGRWRKRLQRQEQAKAQRAKQAKRPAAKAKQPAVQASSPFVVTSDWQMVPAGTELPDGVESNVDPDGVTYARLTPGDPAVGKIVPDTKGKAKQPAQPIKKAAGGEKTAAVRSPDVKAKPSTTKKKKKLVEQTPKPVETPPEPPRVESEDAGGAADPDDDFV